MNLVAFHDQQLPRDTLQVRTNSFYRISEWWTAFARVRPSPRMSQALPAQPAFESI
jgi:hypothetical protein